jgi:DNA-binding response OmpR family regulator
MPGILIIDDDPIFSHIASLSLQKEGYNVACEKDGSLGMKKIEESLPDLVVLDVNLPGMSGFDILSRLKADGRFAGIPIIMVSALSQDVNIARGLYSGCVEYFVKPLSPEELTAAIGRALTKS